MEVISPGVFQIFMFWDVAKALAIYQYKCYAIF